MNKFKITNQRRVVLLISSFLITLSLLGFLISSFDPTIKAPLRLGLDFTGGTQLILERECSPKCNKIKTPEIIKYIESLDLNIDGDNKGLMSKQTSVQLLEDSSSIVLRVPFISTKEANFLIDNLSRDFTKINKKNISLNKIGPKLGGQLLRTSLISLIVSFLAIVLYISFRYDRKFAFLALIALFHDLIIVCGIFSWLGILYSLEVDSLFAVALLTIAGYSVNDTVVVFDRIREKIKDKPSLTINTHVDEAVSATLTRTIYTSSTTLLPLIALIIFGGNTLLWFSVALSLGILVGSWSSIALAPTLLLTRK